MYRDSVLLGMAPTTEVGCSWSTATRVPLVWRWRTPNVPEDADGSRERPPLALPSAKSSAARLLLLFREAGLDSRPVPDGSVASPSPPGCLSTDCSLLVGREGGRR